LRSEYGAHFERIHREGGENLPAVAIPLDALADTCLRLAARRAKSVSDFGRQLKELLRGRDLYLAVGLHLRLEAAVAAGRRQWDESLRRVWNASAEIYPNQGFQPEEFERAVLFSAAENCLRRDLPLSETIRKRMCFPDFYLSAAALSRDPRVAARAAEAFTKKYFPLAQSYVEKKWSTVPQGEDRIGALFFCALYEHTISEKTGNPSKDDSKRPPLLAEYHGQGPLAAWLTLTLGNMIRDSLRTSKHLVSIDEEREAQKDGSSFPKVELAEPESQREEMDKCRCVKILRSGLRTSWKHLKPRERLTLVLQTLMEVPPSVIARRVFHVHEGTITKYTTNALRKIRDGIEKFALSEERMTRDEIAGCLEFMREAFSETETLAGGIVSAASAMEEN